jgi:serine/threonine protein kinase
MEGEEKTESMFPLLGRRLKQYQIESVLGQGGMGVVYRAQDSRLKRPVALKLLPAEGMLSQSARERFLLEARAAARISHPAVAQIYDVDDEGGTIFIAMEWVQGSTIRELIQRGELDLLGTVQIAVQIAEGLARAHELGVIHRDIKPANVIVTPEGHAKILDFGLAKVMQEDIRSETAAADLSTLTSASQTQLGLVKGTPAYMSPEQVRGEKLDARSDLFALGVLIFEMATGQTPFRRDSMVETMRAIAFDETPSMNSIRPNLPSELQRIVGRCLSKRPEDRYPEARTLAEDLRMVRRNIETGRAPFLPFKQRFGDFIERLAHLTPSQYAWMGAGALAMALVIYLFLSDVGVVGFVFFGIASIYVYRRIRHQPQRVMDLMVRKIARLPEVRLIAHQNGHILVAVDRPSGQLYSRINDLLSQYNRKLFFGAPMSITIRDQLSEEERREILSSHGVQFLRD